MFRIQEIINRKKMVEALNNDYYNSPAATVAQSTSPSPVGELLSLSGGGGLITFADGSTAPPLSVKKPVAHTPADEHGRLRGVSVNSKESTSALMALPPSVKPPMDGLQLFVDRLNAACSEVQKKALRVTWCRLTEAPKNSGRGTIPLMERVFEKMMVDKPEMRDIFYKMAFVSCVTDKVKRKGGADRRSIATTRDHARLLVDLTDAIINGLQGTPFPPDIVRHAPEEIGSKHCHLLPLGLAPNFWELFGESFAEVIFTQDCVRAYPYALKAWTILIAMLTDKMRAAYECACRQKMGVPHWNVISRRRKVGGNTAKRSDNTPPATTNNTPSEKRAGFAKMGPQRAMSEKQLLPLRTPPAPAPQFSRLRPLVIASKEVCTEPGRPQLAIAERVVTASPLLSRAGNNNHNGAVSWRSPGFNRLRISAPVEGGLSSRLYHSRVLGRSRSFDDLSLSLKREWPEKTEAVYSTLV